MRCPNWVVLLLLLLCAVVYRMYVVLVVRCIYTTPPKYEDGLNLMLMYEVALDFGTEWYTVVSLVLLRV